MTYWDIIRHGQVSVAIHTNLHDLQNSPIALLNIAIAERPLRLHLHYSLSVMVTHTHGTV